MTGFDPKTQLLPHIVDHYAKVKPDVVYAEYPVSLLSYEQGYRPITFKFFANAINGVAWWLTEKLGPGNGEILAYVGANDIRYPALVLGAIKAGYTMFLTSPRNSVAAHTSLFQRLNCTTLVAPVPRPPPATAILESQSLDVIDVPSVDELITKEYAHFEFSKTYPEAAQDTLAVIHTSGSTGIPKPIFWTHDSACKHMHVSVLEPPEGYDNLESWSFNKRLFVIPPPFHAAGLAYQLFIGIPCGMTIICPTSGGLPTAAAVVEAMKKTPIDVVLGVPSIVQELSQNSDLLEYCSQHLDYMIYCGGDLPQAIGDIVASKVRLMNRYGASEVGMIGSVYSKSQRDPFKDWRYIDFHPRMGVDMRQVSEEEYELVIVRSPERAKHQLSFTIFLDSQEYRTQDLFVRHPDPKKSDLWRWSSRADDVIVFLNGEKTNPVSMEQHIIASNPDVTAALVAGAQRFQASLLVELGEKNLNSTERAAMIEKLWPSIAEANAVTPAHARVAKTHILFTTPEKPMLRAGKGTIQRVATLTAYTLELDALYDDADKLSEEDGDCPSGPGRVGDDHVLSRYIRQTILSITGWNPDKFTDTENFFHLGLDSLQAITATRNFKRGLDFSKCTPNLIYLHPSVSELTQEVLRLQQDEKSSTEARNEALLYEREQILQEFSEKLGSKKASGHTEESHTVILTGSTGNLGSYILDAFLKTPGVAHVHCLNRKEDAIDVQRQKSESYGLDIDFTRVTFWTVDLTRSDLGLHPEALETLQRTVTLVIHNAWAVNFNLSLASFKPQLDGVVNLINFIAHSTKSPHLFFVSSISSTMGHLTESGLTPEEVVTTTTPAPNGYANSKYLAEHLLDRATRQGLVRTSFVRVGQIAGAVRSPGLWNKTEWFPSLALSSLQIGALPDTLGPALSCIDWVPIDLLAEVLVDLSFAGAKADDPSANVFHVVNPNALTWDSVRPTVADSLAKIGGKSVETVSSREWLQRVRQNVETPSAGRKVLNSSELEALLAKNPAAKLLDFFEDIMSESTRVNTLDTQLTIQLSDKLREVESVKPEWIQKWAYEWVM